MGFDSRIANKDGWTLLPRFENDSVEFEILDKWGIAHNNEKGVVLTIEKTEKDVEIPELLKRRVQQITESGTRYGFRIEKAPSEVIELTDGSQVEVPEGLVIVFGKDGLEGGIKFERWLGLASGTVTTAAGIVCSVFLPFGKQIIGGALIGAGTNMITYTVKTNDRNYTSRQLLKTGCEGLATGSFSAAVTKAASPAIKFVGGQIANAVGNSAVRAAAEKTVHVATRMGAQAAASAGVTVVQKIMMGKPTTWLEVRQAAAAGALSGLVGGLIEEAGQATVKEIAKAAEKATGPFPADAYKAWIRFIAGASSGGCGAISSGMLQNYYKGIPLFRGLGTQATISFLVGGSLAFAQICKENALKKTLEGLEKNIKELEEKLKDLDEKRKNEPDNHELEKSYHETYRQLLNCLETLINLWGKQWGFKEVDNLSLEDLLKKLADTGSLMLKNDKGQTIFIQLTRDNFLIITNSAGVSQWISLDHPEQNPDNFGTRCFIPSFNKWLKAYHALQANVPNNQNGDKDALNEKIGLLNIDASQIKAYLAKEHKLNPNAYLKVNIPNEKSPDIKGIIYPAPVAKAPVAERPQPPHLPVPPAPREYKLIYYPTPIVRPPVPVFPQASPFVAPLYDVRVLRVQQIEIPTLQARKEIPQPAALIHSEVIRSQLLKSISRGYGHLEHLQKQAAVTQNGPKKNALIVQIDAQIKRLDQLGHAHTFPNGDRYVGEWRSGKVHGYGEMRYARGGRYEGNWVTGEADGYGEFDFPNGDHYKGTWSGGKMHGHGTYTFANGDVYVGSFVDDNENGYGVCCYNNQDKYEGEWKEAKWNGFGKLTTADGNIKEGIWQNSQLILRQA